MIRIVILSGDAPLWEKKVGNIEALNVITGDECLGCRWSRCKPHHLEDERCGGGTTGSAL
jgi:hypothetical protein